MSFKRDLGSVADDVGVVYIDDERIGLLLSVDWAIRASSGPLFCDALPERGSHCSPDCFKGVLGAVLIPGDWETGVSSDLSKELSLVRLPALTTI